MTDAQFLHVVTGGKVCPGLRDLRDSIAFFEVSFEGRTGLSFKAVVAVGLETGERDRPIIRIGGPK
jgi:hypothetical protein